MPFSLSRVFYAQSIQQGAGGSSQGTGGGGGGSSGSQASAIEGCSKLQALLLKLREVEADNTQVRPLCASVVCALSKMACACGRCAEGVRCAYLPPIAPQPSSPPPSSPASSPPCVNDPKPLHRLQLQPPPLAHPHLRPSSLWCSGDAGFGLGLGLSSTGLEAADKASQHQTAPWAACINKPPPQLPVCAVYLPPIYYCHSQSVHWDAGSGGGCAGSRGHSVCEAGRQDHRSSTPLSHPRICRSPRGTRERCLPEQFSEIQQANGAT